MSVKNFEKESFYRVKRWCAHFLASVPFLLTCAVFLTVICWKSPVLLFCLLFIGLATTVIQQIGQQTRISRHWLIFLQTLAIAAILSFFWIDYFSVPAAAQFFGKAENFFKNNLTQGSPQGSGTAAAVSLVFNVIRALYLLYIAVALIGVVNAVRKDEDWQVVARTPLLVVIAVTIADVLTSFIIG
ncbi:MULTISPECIES: hypothetical protein [Nostocales]|uniref:Uncharacterized protein n=3 Tax=Nostocales TaxID=1161 RepID=A0A0C1N3N6_9CYAN|nr:hypothetical protein [Tolypothrix bouteillei]KAF3885064.1 hypothetical protein DA73_0400006010 [Tolypothrix bouteillei VB521301]